MFALKQQGFVPLPVPKPHSQCCNKRLSKGHIQYRLFLLQQHHCSIGNIPCAKRILSFFPIIASWGEKKKVQDGSCVTEGLWHVVKNEVMSGDLKVKGWHGRWGKHVCMWVRGNVRRAHRDFSGKLIKSCATFFFFFPFPPYSCLSERELTRITVCVNVVHHAFCQHVCLHPCIHTLWLSLCVNESCRFKKDWLLNQTLSQLKGKQSKNK